MGYLQHGRRHAAGGTDPIPGLRGGTYQVPFAYLRTAFNVGSGSGRRSITSGADRYISMQDGVNALFETSDATVFANASTTAITGSALYGVKCLMNGTYRVSQDATFTNGTAGVLAVYYHTISGGNTLSFWQSGRTGTLIGDTWDANSSAAHISFAELFDANVSSPAPVYVVPYANVASGSAALIRCQFLVEYLGPYNGTAL